MEEEKMESKFHATGWWRVLTSEGKLWCETSNGSEALRSMRPGDTIQHLYRKIVEEWHEVIPRPPS